MTEIDLTVKPKKREELPGWYAAMLADQSSSGLSIIAYAKKRGMSAPTLYLWRRRLKAQEGIQMDAIHPGLVEVVLKGNRGGLTQPFVVRLRGDRSLEVPLGFDDDELLRLVQALESC